jgi:putative endonuclease
MEGYNKSLGKFGEQCAEKFLKKEKYKILNRNFLIRGGEIDLIAQKGEYLVFIEVKTRTDFKFGTPSDAVTYHKKQRMIKAAGVYLQRYGNAYARFDVIEVFCR